MDDGDEACRVNGRRMAVQPDLSWYAAQGRRSSSREQGSRSFTNASFERARTDEPLIGKQPIFTVVA